MSGTVGLGSIGGVAVAVTLGGPGATLWMMLAGFLGMSLKFAEVTLSVKYRRVRADGTVTGGAMYYVPEALGRVGMPRLGKFLAGFFCVAAIGGSVTIFQVSQAYSQVRAVTGFDQAFVFGLMRRHLDRHRAVRRREAHREVDRQALAVHVPAVHRRLPRGARRELRQHPAGARHHRA